MNILKIFSNIFSSNIFSLVNTDLVTVQIGDNINIDKGILGSDFGKLVSVDGVSAFGAFGTYKSMIDGRIKAFDQCVHTVTLVSK